MFKTFLILTFTIWLLCLTTATKNKSNGLLDELLDLELAKKLVKEINIKAAGIWTASVNELSRLPLAKQKILCGVKLSAELKINKTEATPPKFDTKPGCECFPKVDFDARTNWSGCSQIIGRIQNQGQCGSCWAVSTASAYTDRYCIARAKKGQNSPSNDAGYQFSALDVLTCSMQGDGCRGGWPYSAWQWIQTKGVCTGTDYTWKSGCKPYPFSPNQAGPAPPCMSSCTASWRTAYPQDKHMGVSAAQLSGSQATVAAIQREIQTNGPVVAIFAVYSDFMSYRSGVYFRTSNQLVGYHAVRIIGWGTQTCFTSNQKVDFWIGANSWGTGWGEYGFFKIRRGVNEVGFEQSGISFGIPKA
ncbi:unnamed protein product [Meloidogyne enterolobii]|uniref:Uncharacterized protein n=1 Tax=Meloidogyne enterolobii TaxID=390850 RepID=A0ACB1AIE2_MELEN